MKIFVDEKLLFFMLLSKKKFLCNVKKIQEMSKSY